MTKQTTQPVDPLTLIAKLPVRQRVAALAEGLLTTNPNTRASCAMLLIEIAGYRTDPTLRTPLGSLANAWRARSSTDALNALARGWKKLDSALRPLALALGREPWINATRALAQSEHEDERLVALSIARNTADPALASLAANLLEDPSARVSKDADQTLLSMALTLLDHISPKLLGPELAAIRDHTRTPIPCDPRVLELERGAMLEAIADAAWSFAKHRRRSPLLASLLLIDHIDDPVSAAPITRMRRLLRERNHPSHDPLRTVLKRTPAPILRLCALRWTAIAPIAPACTDRLEIATDTIEHEIVLDNAHLALDPKRASAIARIRTDRATHDDPDAQSEVLPTLDTLPLLSPRSRRGRLRILPLLDLPTHRRRAHFEPALADPDPAIRLPAVDLVDPIDLTDYMFDSNPTVARHAAMRWSSTGATPPTPETPSWSRRLNVAQTNTRSRDPLVRRIAEEERARLVITDPSRPESRLQARRLAHTDPAGFARLVRALFRDDDQIINAITLVCALSMERRFEQDLLAIMTRDHESPRVRATVVRALGRIDSIAAKRAVQAVLTDNDPRLRANAIETPHVESDTLLEYKGDDHHRVRSSALRRALIDTNDQYTHTGAIEALREMLQDQRETHRTAAVWCAQRALERATSPYQREELKPIASMIEHIARKDHNESVRTRAAACIRRLSTITQWARTADSYEGVTP